jgi:tetrapyrrole methylase family protein/MazG family protein
VQRPLPELDRPTHGETPTGKARITVVGLGPAGPELLTAATTAAISATPVRYVRTRRHPTVVAVPGAVALDRHYERATTVEDVYPAIVEELVAAAVRHGHVLYAVPGSPAVAERTVELLRADARVDVEVVPALSSVDLAWARLGVDPLDRGARIVDGHRFAVEAAGERGPLLVLQCDSPEVLASIKLAVEDGPAVTVLQRLGRPDERIESVAWNALDRVVADHLTSLWIPDLAEPVGLELVRFAELVRTLRERCPWDAEQTHVSLRPYLLEEAYETIEAIDDGDSEHLEEELGDLLFQVFFHAAIGAQEGEFTLADVARGIHDKLVRRHPHVFGGEGGPEDWERLKRAEKGRASAMDGIPKTLPALLYAQEAQRKAAAVGFDWASVEGAWPKVGEELAELRRAAPGEQAGELGDLLFACVNVARHLGVDPEEALRAATAKFRARFAAVEELAGARGLPLPGTPLVVLDQLWEEVKGRRR